LAGSIEVIDDRVSVKLDGWSKIWAMKGRLDVPLAAVQLVETAPAGIKPRGLRAPGSYWPGLIAAGTYRRRGGKEFWSVRNPARAIVISLAGADYDRIVVEVADPAATISTLQAALDRAASAPVA
jgi:hypothetical protein